MTGTVRKLGRAFGRHGDRILGWSLVALGLLSIIITGIYAHRQAVINNCQARVNAAFYSAIIDRAHATNDSNAALKNLIKQTTRLHGTRKQRVSEFSAAVRAWEVKLDAVRSIPLPPPSQRACKG